MRKKEDILISEYIKKANKPAYSKEFTDGVMRNLPQRAPFPFIRILLVVAMWAAVITLTIVYRAYLFEELTLLFAKLENLIMPSNDTLIVYGGFMAGIAFCIQQTFILINEYIENKYSLDFRSIN